MKKIILTAIAVMTLSFANAQDIRFGLKGGINLSSFTGDLDYTSSKVSFQAGGFAEFKISNKFFIQPEIVYSSQGSKYKDFGFNSSLEERINVNYLNIPVMAKYYIIDKLNIEVGPQIGFLIGGKRRYDVIIESGQKFSNSYNSKNDFKNVDFGLNFGAGYDFTEKVFIGVRYNLGLGNVSNYGYGYKAHSSVFSSSVGYKF